MLGATECIGLGVREVAVNEGGYGWVITQKKLDGAGARTMADNTPREYLYYGEVTIAQFIGQLLFDDANNSGHIATVGL